MNSSRWLLLLIILIAIAFAPGLGNRFNGDDHSLFEERASLMRSSDGLKQLLTHSFWWGTGSTGNKQYLYRPWVTFTYWLEFQLGGGQPWIYHASNLLVHLANTALLYAFLYLIMGSWPALIVAAFASLNPAAISCVGWGAERTALWAQLFTLIFLICFRRVRTSETQRGLWIGASMLSYFLAIASMEIAFFAPVLAFMFDWVSPPAAKKDSSRYLWMVVPIVAWVALRAAIGVSLQTGSLISRSFHFIQFLPEQYLRTFASAVFTPHYVCEDELIWSMPPRGGLYYLAWIVFIGLIVLMLAGIRKRRMWAAGGLWFGLSLFPVYALGQAFVPLTDIYTYAALPGIGIFLVDGVRVIWKRYKSGGVVPQWARVAIIGVLVLYGVQTFLRLPLLKDDLTLWTHMIKVRPNYVPALMVMSEYHFNSGDAVNGFALLDRAAVREPNNQDVHTQFVIWGLQTGQLDRARQHAERLERIGGNNYRSMVNVARYYLEAGDCQKAVALFQRSEQLHLPTPDVLFDYGRALLCVNDNAGALKAYQAALQQRPDWPEAMNNLGICYENMGQYAQAAQVYKSALKLNSQLPVLWRSLAIASAKAKDVETAQTAAKQFMSFNPPPEQVERLKQDLAAAGIELPE